MWFVMLRPQFFFYLRRAHERKYNIFFVRSTSICLSLSSFLMYCTFAIINNLLFSLQNKFPFVFFPFCEFMLMDPHTDIQHAGPAMLQILHYSSSSSCSIPHYYHDLTVALLIFAFHNFFIFFPKIRRAFMWAPERHIITFIFWRFAWTRHAAAIVEKAETSTEKHRMMFKMLLADS